MARKKKPDEDPNANPPSDGQQEVATLPEPSANGTHETQAPEPEVNGHQNGSRKPIASWRVMSDGTTSIEAAVWSNMLNGRNGEYEQLTVTITRSYKSEDVWRKGGSFRVHDLPVLQWLLTKVHDFALTRRADIEIPF